MGSCAACLGPLLSSQADMWLRERRQIASRALHLATDTHFMFTNEPAEEMASFGATGKGDVQRKPVGFCLFFQLHLRELRGGAQLWDQVVLLQVVTNNGCSCCTWPVLLARLHEQLWHQSCYFCTTLMLPLLDQQRIRLFLMILHRCSYL